MPVLVAVAWLVLSCRTFVELCVCVFSGVSLVRLWHLPQVKNRMLLFTPILPPSSPPPLPLPPLNIPAVPKVKKLQQVICHLRLNRWDYFSYLISFFPVLWLDLSSSTVLHSAFSLHFSTSQWWRVCLMKWLMGVYYRETEWSGRLL